ARRPRPPCAARALRRPDDAGWLVVVVTNQSGIARRLLAENDYRRVSDRLDELRAGDGARIDASYHCPHLPEISGPCACRKPGFALFEQAAAAHGLAPARSASV